MNALPEFPPSGRIKDLSGKVFGRLTVLSYAGGIGKSNASMWRCRCECGAVKVIRSSCLCSGNTQSCGCYAEEVLRERTPPNLTHGYFGTRMYGIWAGIVSRCTNHKHRQFHNYGGRGIKICQRWRNSPVAFIEDMSPRTSPNHSIDREDNDAHYSCGKCEECHANGWTANCRWATYDEQAQNRRPPQKRPASG